MAATKTSTGTLIMAQFLAGFKKNWEVNTFFNFLGLLDREISH